MAFVKKVINRGLRGILVLLPFSLLIKIDKKELLLPLYHTVSDKRIPHLVNLFPYCSVKQFERDMDFLLKYYSPVSLSDLMNSLKGNTELPEKSFLLSFDDGYREVVEIIAPILKRRSIPSVFFLNSAFIDNKEMFYRNKASLIIDNLDRSVSPEVINKLSTIVTAQEPTIKNIKAAILGVNYEYRHLLDEIAQVLQIDFGKYLKEKQPYINSDEIRNLINQGFIIGAHSEDHPLFRDIQLDEQLSQALNSLALLRKQFSVSYNYFAFPNTDKGVSRDFFTRTHFNGLIDISFGTADFYNGSCFNHLQRQPMERGSTHAELIYKRLFSQEILDKVYRGLHF